ncbi:hypothetical protein ACTJIJ_26190 [Niabella sp. 22666]|uniref:hypothetical protein n=1 Tax=Niabella sp. 22666 TaxID=3453954 RepID=UPI003F8337AE
MRRAAACPHAPNPAATAAPGYCGVRFAPVLRTGFRWSPPSVSLPGCETGRPARTQFERAGTVHSAAARR